MNAPQEAPIGQRIGQSVVRREDPRLLTGRGRFTDDIALPGLTHAVFVRSPHGHARLLKVDAAQALAAPGVIAVLTSDDLRGKVGNIRPNWVVGDSIVPVRTPLADGEVRFVGEPIACVIAATLAQAMDAADLVDVSYDLLPVVVDEEAALKPGAPQLHANVPGNLIGTFRMGGGDYKAAAAAADHLVDLRVVNQRLIPSPIEPRAVRAAWSEAEGRLTIYLPSQVPHMSKRWLAETLGWPEHKIHLVAPDIGGGFGAKMHFYPEEILVAFAARHLGRPVSWTETRSESHVATTHGRAHVEYVQAAVKADGQVLGVRLLTVANLGAYLSNMATGIPTVNTTLFATGNYRIPALAAEVRLVTTNTVPVDAYRGAGRPEAAYLIERLMDAVADRLQIDPVELRRRNVVPSDAFPYVPFSQPAFRWDSGRYGEALEEVVRQVRYDEWRERQQALRTQGRYIGIGVINYMEMVGMGISARLKGIGFDRGGWESAQIRVHSDGRITLFSGSMAQGHGHQTCYAQIAADVLKLPMDDIEVVQGDTDRVPAGHGTFNSRSMSVGGSAVHAVSKSILAKARKIAAHLLSVEPDAVLYEAGVFQSPQDSQRTVTFAQVARIAHVASSLPAGLSPGLDEIVFFEPKGSNAPHGAHAAVVEVDVETGVVEILDYVSVDDVGTLINPMLCHGQVHGGIAQGIGQALYEEARYDSAGQLLSGSLLDYTIPKSTQVPRIRSSFQITPSPTNPLGVKGIGEAGCVGAPPAIVSAVCDALRPFGIRHIDMPLTPPKVWRAIQDAQRAGQPG